MPRGRFGCPTPKQIYDGLRPKVYFMSYFLLHEECSNDRYQRAASWTGERLPKSVKIRMSWRDCYIKSSVTLHLNTWYGSRRALRSKENVPWIEVFCVFSMCWWERSMWFSVSSSLRIWLLTRNLFMESGTILLLHDDLGCDVSLPWTWMNSAEEGK